jgi:cob(I)alamin adenosyltransferase
MKIYTRTGDKGSTSLFGGDRVSKSSVRLHAYGTLDELNAELGVIVSNPELPTELKTQLQEIQILLFSLGADLATPIKSTATIVRVSVDHTFVAVSSG